MSTLGQFDAIFNILFILTIISLAARRFHIPSVSALIVAGIMSSISSPFHLPSLEPEMFTALLLPPIIFAETLHTDVDIIIDDSEIILAYAVIGTLLMMITVASFVHFVLGFTIIEALILGILLSPTDPVAVIYAFHQMGVVKRFQLIVSGESLFNDGVAIALFSIVISIITLGSLTVLDAVKISSVSILGGAILGLLGGYVAHFLFCLTDDRFAEVLVSFLVAFGVFRISESIGASGVIATVVAGLIINYRTRYFGGVGKESIEMLETLWEFVGFAASSVAFIFIGVNFEPAIFLSSLGSVVLLFILLLFLRYLTVEVIAELLELTSSNNIPRNWRLGLFWSGLRGAVSIVLVLGLNRLMLPNSEAMIALTFGVVIISNLLHGPSIPRVVRRLNLHTRDVGVIDSSYESLGLNWMSDRYVPGAFDAGRTISEKIIFSMPEFFVFETRLGGWILTQLQRVRARLKENI